jgi:hypothetical protein
MISTLAAIEKKLSPVRHKAELLLLSFSQAFSGFYTGSKNQAATSLLGRAGDSGGDAVRKESWRS